jgi:hypothetical protein
VLLSPLFAAVLACSTQADPPPTIKSPSPDIVQRGVTALITIQSADSKRRFNSSCRVVFTEADGAVADIRKNHGNRITVAINLPNNASLRARDLRVVSDFGVSNTVRLFFADRPVLLEQEPNNTASQAQLLNLGTLVSGTIHAATEQDRWRFVTQKGQTFEMVLTTKALASSLDPTMTVVTPDGRLVAWSSPTPSQQTRLLLPCTTNEIYHLIIHDVQFRGGKNYHYHLRTSTAESSASTIFPAKNSRPEKEPNNQASDQNLFTPPFAISARITDPTDVDVFNFDVKTAQTLILTADSSPFLSTVDPLLELRDAKGQRIRIDDDSGPGNTARIQHKFQPGRYTAAVRNLLGQGGNQYSYLFRVDKPISPAADFEIRFQPDAVRVKRHSNTKLWCEITRRGGFKGPVKLTFPNPPPGISISPIELGPGNRWTSVFTIHANADAVLGSTRLQLAATAAIGGKSIERYAVAEVGGKISSSAWVTVLEKPPVLVQPVGPTSAAARKRWKTQRAKLSQRLTAPSPKLASELEAFQQDYQAARHWIALAPTKMISRRRISFSVLEDGSILAGTPRGGSDTYDIDFDCPLENITAIRLDALPHPSLPAGGPGRHQGSGNFVINRLLLAAAPRGQGDATAQVKLVKPKALLAQTNFDASRALDNNIKTGWAMYPYSGRRNWFIAELHKPIQNSGGTSLRLTLDQLHGTNHFIGRFRLSVATTRLSGDSRVVPPQIHTALLKGKNPKAVAKWFRTISPSLTKLRDQIAAIDTGQGNQQAIEQIEQELRLESPAHIAARQQWEAEMLTKLEQPTPLASTKTPSKKSPAINKPGLPKNLVTALSTPSAKRQAAQHKLISDWFRQTSPELKALRARADLLRAEQVAYPPRLQRGKTSSLAVRVQRSADHQGPITVTLQGYSSGRNKNRGPRAITPNLAVKPVTLQAGQSVAVLSLRATNNCELGTRAVVIQATTTHGGRQFVEYSAPVLVSVSK